MLEITKEDIEGLSKPKGNAGSPPDLLNTLVRCLINCTVPLLDTRAQKFQDNINQPGWDGELECHKGHAWAPEGKSFWEISTRKDVQTKFKEDFDKRTERTSSELQKESTFVFVTNQKEQEITWENGDWGKVDIYFSKDLADWVNKPEALAVKIWLAEQIDKPMKGLVSGIVTWEQWAVSGKKSIPKDLVLADRANSIEELGKFLKEKPGNFFTVYADSREEATAFVCAACLEKGGQLSKYENKLIVVNRNPENIRTLISAAGAEDYVFLLENQEMAERIGDLSGRVHIIIAEPMGNDRNVQKNNSTILWRVSKEKFKDFLFNLKGEEEYSEKQAAQIAEHYGMSVTIFRRYYSDNQAIKDPKWAKTDAAIVAALVGQWNSENRHDRDFIEAISERKYSEIEKELSLLHEENDSPVERWGNVWQVRSHFDALSAVCNRIPPYSFNRFLGEICIRSQQIGHDKLMKGPINTLSILSVLFKRRNNTQFIGDIERTIKHILNKGSEEFLVFADLSLLAEASPEEFLRKMERDLGFGEEHETTRHCIRFALQILAWEEQYVDQIVNILLRLIKDKNFGEDVLFSFFVPWLPQCGASVEARNKKLDKIVCEHPDIGWRICLSMLREDFAVQNSMPKWRNMPSSTEMEITVKEKEEAVGAAIQNALSFLDDDAEKILKIIELIPRMGYQERISRVLERIVSLHNAGKILPDKAPMIQNALRGLLRTFEIWGTQTKKPKSKKVYEELCDQIGGLYNLLMPRDIVQRHLWLFSDSPDVPERFEISYKKIEQSVKKRRCEAVREILDEKGRGGILDLCRCTERVHYVAQALPLEWSEEQRLECILAFMAEFSCYKKGMLFIHGIFSSKGYEYSNFVYDFIAQNRHKEWGNKTVLAFVMSDFFATKKLWEVIDHNISEIAADYWKNVSYAGKKDQVDLSYFVRKKLEHDQALDALQAASINDFVGLDGKVVMKILKAIPDKKEASNFHTGYCIEEALLYIAQEGGVEEVEILDFELECYKYMGKVKPREIFRKLALDSGYFAEKVKDMLGFLREKKKKEYLTWHNIMDEWKAPPGVLKDKSFCEESFRRWISSTKKLAAEDRDLQKKVDRLIGGVLVHLPQKDNLLPEAALEIMDREDAEEIRDSFGMGVRISRGVYVKSFGEGGNQERELAAKYNGIAQKLTDKGFGRVALVYREIAEDYERDAEREDIRSKTDEDW